MLSALDVRSEELYYPTHTLEKDFVEGWVWSGRSDDNVFAVSLKPNFRTLNSLKEKTDFFPLEKQHANNEYWNSTVPAGLYPTIDIACGEVEAIQNWFVHFLEVAGAQGQKLTRTESGYRLEANGANREMPLSSLLDAALCAHSFDNVSEERDLSFRTILRHVLPKYLRAMHVEAVDYHETRASEDTAAPVIEARVGFEGIAQFVFTYQGASQPALMSRYIYAGDDNYYPDYSHKATGASLKSLLFDFLKSAGVGQDSGYSIYHFKPQERLLLSYIRSAFVEGSNSWYGMTLNSLNTAVPDETESADINIISMADFRREKFAL